MVEEQSYNNASATPYYKPSAEKSDATPMELGNAMLQVRQVRPYDGSLLCQTCCWGQGSQQNVLNPKGGVEEPASRTGSDSTPDKSGNTGAQ
ncbi:unnamed protein product [Peronospora farinosa]|uniref:Uncharacterized protein n=1 Tax=Peronospora farinosa TaxID=134698 RepID=A0ABN8CEN8_9STRA|nr:unnamed protein product [Peronospora farinosa]